MKKRSLLLVLLVFLGTAPLSALPGGLRAELSTQFGSSIVSRYVSVNAALLYQPAFAGFGGGIKNVVGISEIGYYIAPYGRVQMGPVYLGTGASIPAVQPSEKEAVIAELAPFATIGISATPFPLGPGSLGFDISIDAVFTAVPRTSNGETEVEKAAGTILAPLLGAMKGFIGIAYSF